MGSRFIAKHRVSSYKYLSLDENETIDKIFVKIGCYDDKVKNDFKIRYSSLHSEEERKLILDLTRRFTYIPLSQYKIHLEKAVNNFIGSLNKNKRVAVMNAVIRSDFGKIKSNYLISYQFKGLNLIKNINWGSKLPLIIDDFKSLVKVNDLDKIELILVDDFLGSGETVEGAYNYLFNRLRVHGKTMPHVSVVCIVAMQSAVELLAKMSIKVYTSLIVNRGIADYYKEEELSKAYEMMEAIEKRINVKSKFKFGYDHSEALVCMERCPNNTFPFYWFNVKYGEPPFRR